MSDYRDPVRRANGQNEPVRHRRSDRYRQAEEIPAAPREAQEEPIQWSRRAPDGNFNTRDDALRPVVRMADTNEYYDDANDYDEDERGAFPWRKVLLIVLAAALILGMGLFLYKTFIRPVKPQPEAVSFQTPSNEGMTDTRMVFSVTTNQAMDGVKIVNENDEEIEAVVNQLNGSNETNRIWQVQAVFDEPYTGNIYAMIRSGNEWKKTDKSVALVIASPTPAPTEAPTEAPTPAPTETPTPAPTEAPTPAPTDAPAVIPASTDAPEATRIPETAVPVPAVTWAPTNPPAVPDAPFDADATDAPTALPTLAPTDAPTDAPTPAPTEVPTPTPMPRLEAQSGGIKVTEKTYQGGKSLSFQRAAGYIAPNPDQYSYYAAGVLTFRGDNFRRNAAFGTVNVEKGQLNVLWKAPIGSLRTADSGTLYGVGWTGQPAIVKWTTEVRQMMNLYEDKKNTMALREVIFGAQDGNIYFLDLRDGTPTRDPISVGFPMKGSVAVDAYGRPLLAVGQGVSKLPNKTGSIGLHVYYLTDGTEAFLLNGRKSSTQVQYTTNGAFDGTPLFLYDSDAMIVAGENGLLYTVDLNSKFVYPTAEEPDAEPSMKVNRAVTYLYTKADAEKDAQVGVESSVAMYDKYIFMADTYGVVRCVDSDTMKTVWAVDCGDNTDAAVALDMDGDGTVSLYTGNTAYARLTNKKDVTIRRLNAMTGEEIWAYSIKAEYAKDQTGGCKASPVIGQKNVSDLVFFTVNRVEKGSRLVALDKRTGAEVWTKQLEAEAVSSPVAVYNDQGDAWIIQGDEGGRLTMLNARTGQTVTTLELGGPIEGSPAVYKNYLVVGTSGSGNSFMYGILIE